MIEIIGVSKKYGSHQALKNVSLKVRKGELFGILGRSGAGKSTLMNIIAGCIHPDYGNVSAGGYDMSQRPIQAKLKIGYLPQCTPLYSKMTVKEYLVFACRLKRVPKKHISRSLDSVIEKTRLADANHCLIANLAMDYRRRVALAGALCGDPEILLLDEPTHGLAPESIADIRTIIKLLGADHTVLLSTQNLHDIAEACDHLAIINKGEIVLENALDSLVSTFNDRHRVIVRLMASKQTCLGLLNSIDIIDTIEYIGSKEPGSCDFMAESLSKDLRAGIFHAAAKANIVLLGIKSMCVTLQDIFVQLTGENKEVS